MRNECFRFLSFIGSNTYSWNVNSFYTKMILKASSFQWDQWQLSKSMRSWEITEWIKQNRSLSEYWIKISGTIILNLFYDKKWSILGHKMILWKNFKEKNVLLILLFPNGAKMGSVSASCNQIIVYQRWKNFCFLRNSHNFS